MKVETYEYGTFTRDEARQLDGKIATITTYGDVHAMTYPATHERMHVHHPYVAYFLLLLASGEEGRGREVHLDCIKTVEVHES